MIDPVCPICGADYFTVEEQDDSPHHTVCLEVSCQRCDSGMMAVYTFVRHEQIEIINPYGPEYLTQDAQHALMAWEGHAGEWQTIRTNGTWFAVGYEPWMYLYGYGYQQGWFDCTQEMSEILTQEGACDKP